MTRPTGYMADHDLLKVVEFEHAPTSRCETWINNLILKSDNEDTWCQCSSKLGTMDNILRLVR